MLLYTHPVSTLIATNTPRWYEPDNSVSQAENDFSQKNNGSLYCFYHGGVIDNSEHIIKRTEQADQTIKFQQGPFGKNGELTNGVTVEAILAVAEDRLAFLRGNKEDEYTTQAINHIRDALGVLLLREQTIANDRR